MHGYANNSQHLEHSPVSRSVVSFLYLSTHLILPKLYEEGPVGLYYKRLGSLNNLTGLASWLGGRLSNPRALSCAAKPFIQTVLLYHDNSLAK